MKLDYCLLDVFTTAPLSGNPLAVVSRADGLLDNQMQRIAAEFNLSETVFITKPKSERHSAPCGSSRQRWNCRSQAIRRWALQWCWGSR